MIKINVDVEVSDDPDYCGGCRFWNGSAIGHWCIITGWNSDQDGTDTMKQGWCKNAIQKAKSIEAQVKMLKESPLDPMHPERNL